MAVTILPLGALVFRDRPERFGLVVDGAAAPRTTADAAAVGAHETDRAAGAGTAAAPAPVVAEVDYTAEEARSTLTFWLIAGGLVLTSSMPVGRRIGLVRR